MGVVADGVVISGDPEAAEEEDAGLTLLAPDDSDQRPLCLPGAAASAEARALAVLGVKGIDESQLAAKPVPRPTVVSAV